MGCALAETRMKCPWWEQWPRLPVPSTLCTLQPTNFSAAVTKHKHNCAQTPPRRLATPPQVVSPHVLHVLSNQLATEYAEVQTAQVVTGKWA